MQPVLLVGMATRWEFEFEDIKSIAPDDKFFKLLKYDAMTLILDQLGDNFKDDRGNPMFLEPEFWDHA